MKYGQTMISRETRRLLVTIAVSIGLLWVLARIRFQERTSPPTAVAPVLAQLRPTARYEDLARTIADLRPIVSAALVPAGAGTAFRISDDRAVTVNPDDKMQVVAIDRATQLAVIGVDAAEPAGIIPWMPRVLDYPRFFLVAERAHDGIAVRPIFAGTLTPVASPYWESEVWQLPAGVDLPPGKFVFTTEGALAGASIVDRGQAALVPAAQLLKVAQQLAATGGSAVGTLGVEVQPLTPALAAAAGASAGVIVNMVDEDGPAATVIAPTDVIEAINGRVIRTIDDWHANVLRLAAGDTVSLKVRSDGEVRDVRVTATAPTSAQAATGDTPAAAANQLGLQLAAVSNLGSRIVRVLAGSIGDRAALRPGDLITAAGRQTKPTPSEVVQAFTSLDAGESLILAFTRGNTHHLVTLGKPTSGTP